MARRSRYEVKTHDMGDGFYVHAEKWNNWTEYCAMQLDRPGGYVENGRSFRSCYRRDADAKIAEWKAQDQVNK